MATTTDLSLKYPVTVHKQLPKFFNMKVLISDTISKIISLEIVLVLCYRVQHLMLAQSAVLKFLKQTKNYMHRIQSHLKVATIAIKASFSSLTIRLLKLEARSSLESFCQPFYQHIVFLRFWFGQLPYI